jgi:hypothetical protein
MNTIAQNASPSTNAQPATRLEIPDPTTDPLGYLRLISRDLRVAGNTTASNGILDAISALRVRQGGLRDCLKSMVSLADAMGIAEQTRYEADRRAVLNARAELIKTEE